MRWRSGRLPNWTTHLLTHVDAPLHFIPGGATLDTIELSRFHCQAVVVEVDGPVVTAEHVPERPLADWGVLFRTRNSDRPETAPFDTEHVYIDQEAAQLLVKRSVNLVGIDYLSVDRFGDEQYPVHRCLLGAQVLVLEGLLLADVAAGNYTLSAWPLKIAGADGSPVRALLSPEEDR